MRKLSPQEHQSIRDRSHAQARKRVATEVGEMLLGRESSAAEFASVEAFEAYAEQVREAESARERDWVASYMAHYYRAFAYYTAFELSGADAEFARECLRDPDIAAEIASRVALGSAAINGS